MIISSNYHVATEGNSEDQGRQYTAAVLRDESHVSPSYQNPERCASLFLRINPFAYDKMCYLLNARTFGTTFQAKEVNCGEINGPSSMSMSCTVEKLALPSTCHKGLA